MKKQLKVQGWVKLVNQAVRYLDPWSNELTEEQRQAIYEECKVNSVYFFYIILGNDRTTAVAYDEVMALEGQLKEMSRDEAANHMVAISRAGSAFTDGRRGLG